MRVNGHSRHTHFWRTYKTKSLGIGIALQFGESSLRETIKHCIQDLLSVMPLCHMIRYLNFNCSLRLIVVPLVNSPPSSNGLVPPNGLAANNP